MASSSSLAGYRGHSFTAPISGVARTFDVYSRGEGPPIVLVQELPGIGPETLRLAERLVEAGFAVELPHLFGPLGEVTVTGNLVRVMCMRREFSLFSRNRSSPITEWLRALCRDVRIRRGHAGVGVIGMCLTGNFAISLMGEETVRAAVAAQPSLPVLAQRSLHMSPAEAAAAKAKLAVEGPMLVYRFEGDRLCGAAKFAALDEAFNDGQTCLDLKTLPGDGHSVFTLDFVDEAGHPTRAALEEVIAYFRSRLL